MEMKDPCETHAETLEGTPEATKQFVKTIVHDCNNMLTAIIGYGEILKMDLEGDSRSQHYLDLILEAARKAADLTQHFLVLSEPEAVSSNERESSPGDEGV